MVRLRFVVPAVVGLVLALAPPAAHASTVPAQPATATYYFQGDASLSHYTPSSQAPLTETGRESITGQFELRREPTSPYYGTTYYTVLDAQLTAMPSGRTYSSTGSGNSFVCWPSQAYCQTEIELSDSAGGTVFLETTGIAPFGPRPSEPAATYPTSYTLGDSRNIYTGYGYGLYTRTVYWDEDEGVYDAYRRIVGAVRGMAARDPAPPSVAVTSPALDAVYEVGQVVPVEYTCTDPAGVHECRGPVESGQQLDTSTPGSYAFVVTAGDGWGNTTSQSVAYTVIAPALPPGALARSVSGGETVTTGSEATADVPVQTSITVPAGVAGDISVTPEAPGAAPTGYYLFGRQLVVDGPAATVEAPYTMTFTVDGSALGGIAPSDVQVFRNGVAVTGCTGPTAAVPDPCVVSRGFGTGGDAVVTVRTSRFSVWNLGRLDYDLGPVLAPVDPLPTVNVVKAGSTVPIKFSLGGDRGLDVLAGSPQVSTAGCAGAPADAVEQTVAASMSGLTYGDGVYQYNWKSAKSTTGCRSVTVTFRDGSTLEALFQLR